VSPPPKPVGVWQFLAGVVLPFICLVLGFPLLPDWQSGTPDAYAQLLLSHLASMPLYPFLLYSMVSMVLLLANPARFCENVWVRFGIFNGVFVAAEYWLIFQVAFHTSRIWEVTLSALAAFVPWVIWRFLGLFGPYRNRIVACGLLMLFVAASAIKEVFGFVAGLPPVLDISSPL
jgi:hypothetical protein